MKDGWTYAGNLTPTLGLPWQCPNLSYPFPVNDPLNHGDMRYHRPGAAWNDTYISMSGGQQLLDSSDPFQTYQGSRQLHAFNVCAGDGGRLTCGRMFYILCDHIWRHTTKSNAGAPS